MADLFGEHDQLAIVTFSTIAAVHYALTTVDTAGRAQIRTSLTRLAADGSTNLQGGIDVAAGVLAAAPAGLRRVMVVLSDGQPNIGLRSADELAVEETIVAYEPVWAIGTGRTATSEQAQEGHAFIRRQLAVLHGEGVAKRERISVWREREDVERPGVDEPAGCGRGGGGRGVARGSEFLGHCEAQHLRKEQGL